MRYIKPVVYTVLYLFTIGIVISSILLTPHPFDSPLVRVMRTVIIFFASVLLGKYTIYMVLAPFYGVFAKRDKELISHFVREYNPLVSVMIPAWNEEVGLLNTVKTLLGSTYKRLELVIVNDGSTDNSDALMRAFIAKYVKEMAGVHPSQRIEIVYHYQQNGGKGSALNTAIALSHGDILVSIDADCIVDSHAIEAFVEAFRDFRVMAAVGNVKIGNTKTLLGTIQALEYCFGFYGKRADSVLNTIYIVGGAAGAFRREVFEKLGGYDCKNITEDIELSTRIQKAGMKIVYCPDALIYTEGASTLQGLMKQRLRWKRGRFQTFWQHRDLFFSLDPKHNKLLCWVALPLAMFSEMQLAMEPLFLAALYILGFLSADFSAFISGIIVVSLMFAVQAMDSKEQSGSSIGLALIGWLLFYVCSFVECYALAKSIWLMMRKKEATWQRWKRQGALEK
jgi:poly-beta-1,6-N-acetyl-D-glucosamine synthase